MNHLLRSILLLAVLCLTGCSKEEEPQTVVLSMTTYDKIDEKGEIIYVQVTANCPWHVDDNSELVNIDILQNEDYSGTIGISIKENLSYDDLTHIITVTSEDGTSSATLTIYHPCMPRLEYDVLSYNLSAEEGTFELPVRTNDEIISVETPDWITLTSSRSLTNYTYNFIVESNKTGTIRNGDITLKGKEISKSINVIQDSYAPVEIDFTEILPVAVSENEFSIGFNLYPEYADVSKLKWEASNNCDITISESRLNVKLNEYGEFVVSASVGEKELCKLKSEYIPEILFNPTLIQVCVGQTISLNYWYYSKDYILHSSDPNAVEIIGNHSFKVRDYGSYVVSATHPVTGSHARMEIQVEPFLLESRLAWLGEKSDGSFDVQFTALIQAMEGSFINGYYVVDKEGHVLSWNQGNIREYYDLGFVIETIDINVKYDGSKYHNILDALDGYVFNVSATVDGVPYQKSIKVNTYHVGSY